jgi:predicted ATPase
MATVAAGSFGQPVVCPVLIGRGSTVSALRRLVDAVEGGRGQLALITGEAGIGKSRLVAETRAYASERGLLVLEGACFPQDRTCPYAPLLDLLRARFAHRPSEATSGLAGPFAADLYRLVPDLVPRPADPPSAPALDPEQERRRLFDALVHALLGAAEPRPLLVVVEDLH